MDKCKIPRKFLWLRWLKDNHQWAYFERDGLKRDCSVCGQKEMLWRFEGIDGNYNDWIVRK